MISRRYSILGWLVWQVVRLLVRPKVAKRRAKLGAAGLVALVLIGGVLAAREAGPDAVKKH